MLTETGLRKAAILVDCLQPQVADTLLERLPVQDADRVRHTWMALGRISESERDDVIREFLRSKQQPAALAESLQQPLNRTEHHELPKPVTQEPLPESTEANRDDEPFRLLKDTEADKLLRILQEERPPTIALVLAHLPPQQAGAVLVRFPQTVQVEIVRCLVDLEETDPDVLREVDRALESKLSELVGIQRRRVAGLSALAGIVRQSQESVGYRILDNLATRAPELAERLMPVPALDFNQFIRFDDAALGTIFEHAEENLVVLALWGTPLGFVDRVLNQFPGWKAQRIRAQLAEVGPIRLRDVEEARRRFAELARQLAARRRIRLPPELQTSTARQTQSPPTEPPPRFVRDVM